MAYSLRRLSYPKNFIMDMFNHSTKKVMEVSMGIVTFPKSTESVVLYRQVGLRFIFSCLSEEERKIVELKYKDRQTAAYIARYLNTTPRDIDKRVQKIRSKLTHPSRFKYILYDITQSTSDMELSFNKEEFNKIYIDDFVDLLDLSDRSSNALFRNELYRITDIINVKNDNDKKLHWYGKLRNVGMCTAKEIDDKLRELNFI